MKKKFLLGLSLMTSILFPACSSDDDETDGPDKEARYEMTYSVSEISEDLFTCTNVLLTYADKEGKEQSVTLTEKNMPFSVTLNGLNADSRLFFDIAFDNKEDVNLTKEKYVFTLKSSYILNGDEGLVRSSSLANVSSTIDKSNVSTYLGRFIDKTYSLDTTIKELIAKQ